MPRHGHKARVCSIGPMVACQYESGVRTLDFKILHEFGVRNRPQGQLAWMPLNLCLD